LLCEFSGVPHNRQAIEYTPPSPWADIQYRRVEAATRPSGVSWRKVEAISAGGSGQAGVNEKQRGRSRVARLQRSRSLCVAWTTLAVAHRPSVGRNSAGESALGVKRSRRMAPRYQDTRFMRTPSEVCPPPVGS